ncbi:HEPN domain protein [Vibrio aerogenes CECT 7868]|uniref:HEPN domain protein n=1 Tax=Vibrio aerogenes CECT 7868 TaxID=1216006 RepID=A0A1M5VMT0_9VIBR|nr:HEPN domain-containing protein [Vibrio aerogenes]SHH76552.1 HEPN domain protein [Vibrio aerogenes CECT 7868]
MKKSLDHLPESNQHQIRQVANIIRNEVDELVRQRAGKQPLFKVQKIILFGSYARQPDAHGRTPWVYDPANGYLSDYDILVVVNHQALVDDHRLWHLVDDKIQRLIPDIPVGVIVHTLNEVNNWLSQGLYFFKDIREQGIELFSEGTRELARPGHLTDEEKRAISQKHFDIWFKKAEDNFIVYDLVRQHPQLDVAKAAFELHQATEALLACTLLTCTNYLPKVHDPIKLKSFCAQQDPRFADLFPMETKFHRRSMQRLKRAYVEGRYSDHYEITEEELTYLAGEVVKLKALVEVVCLARLGKG